MYIIRKRILTLLLCGAQLYSIISLTPLTTFAEEAEAEVVEEPKTTVVTNNNYYYYYIDSEYQFRPKVGIVTSINNSPSLYWRQAGARNKGTAMFNPDIQELPDIISKVGKTEGYGALYSGYWNTNVISSSLPENSTFTATLVSEVTSWRGDSAIEKLSTKRDISWYERTDTVRTTQKYDTSQYNLQESADRALKVLGTDILLRDEYVTLHRESTSTPLSKQASYSYTYFANSMLDSDKEAMTPCLDYIIQSMYKAIGQYCLTSDVFIYKDLNYSINNTPLATELVVTIDELGADETANRVDIFSTTTNLDEYWKRAIADGIVTSTGVLNFTNTIGAETFKYKTDKNEEAGPDKNPIKYEAQRFTTVSLADFCVYLKNLMHIYGEEVLTDKEQEILLLNYGTKLPYYLENAEQLEAIKYLMAKGIVDDQMAWSMELTLWDMLTILSRVKDTASRLTFKNVQITYDQYLLDQGFIPTDMKIDDPNMPTIEAVTKGANNVSYEGAKYVDFFLRQDNIKLTNAVKDTTSTYFNSYTDDGNAKGIKDEFYLGYGPQGGTWVDKKPTDFTQKYIKNKGYVNLGDGYRYLHLQIDVDVIKGNTPELFLRNNMLILSGNTENTDKEVTYWRVSKYGGIYTSPTVGTYADEKGKTKTKWVIQYTNDFYLDSYSVDTTQTDLSSKHIAIGDIEAYKKNNISDYSIITHDGKEVNLAAVLIEKASGVNQNPTNALTFDMAGWDLKYVDWRRLMSHYSFMLETQPLLSSSDILANGATSIGSIKGLSTQFDILFSLPYETKDFSGKYTLAEDYYLGTINESNLAINRNSPLTPNDKLGFEYLYAKDGKLYYTLHGATDTSSFLQEFHTSGNGITPAWPEAGYSRQGNTFLIKASTLIKLASGLNSQLTDGQANVLKSELTDKGVLIISFAYGNSGQQKDVFSTPFNIVLNEALHTVSVGNMIYQVPKEEMLWYEVPSTGEFLVNYRVALGWNSGFKTAVDAEGVVSLSVGSTKEKNNFAACTNIWTGLYTLVSATKITDDVVIMPVSGMNPLSQYCVYQSLEEGTFLISAKLMDTKSTNPVADKEKLKTSSFAEASVYKWFGLLPYSSDNYYLTVTQLTRGPDKEWRRDDLTTLTKDDQGKFFYNSTYGWVHTVPSRTLSSVRNNFTSRLKEYYKEDKINLPYFYTYSSNKLRLYDYTSNVITGQPYGTIPYGAKNVLNVFDFYGTTEGDHTAIFKDNPELSLMAPIIYNSTEDWKINSVTPIQSRNILTLPYGITLSLTLHATAPVTDSSIFSSTITVAWFGNYKLITKFTDKASFIFEKPDTYKGTGNILIESKEGEVAFLGVTAKGQWINVGSLIFDVDDRFLEILDKNLRGELTAADDVLRIDWGKYTFKTLIHDVDNGMSIVLIIALNIIPRIGLFLFLILIALATIANMRPVKLFCHNIWDPYSFVTFGHSSVDTVNTAVLLVSSIIGLAIFGMFMDGAIINLLAWLVQWVTTILTH